MKQIPFTLFINFEHDIYFGNGASWTRGL